MKRFYRNNKNIFLFVFLVFFIWRIFLIFAEVFSHKIVQHPGYIGPIPWANMDGVHYLNIARQGYVTYEQAFFPLFPLLIKLFAPVFGGNYAFCGLLISYVSFFIALVLFYKLLLIDYAESIVRWSLIFLLVFPTSFFFVSVYTESLFLMLVFASFYFARRGSWLASGVFAALAGMTRLVGVFLLPALIFEWLIYSWPKNATMLHSVKEFAKKAWGIFLAPLGTVFYMFYLWRIYSDPLLFIHSQPAFGAGRSSGNIILLPQVFYRYIKIFLTIPPLSHDFLIAFLEIAAFSIFLLLLVIFRQRVRFSYLIFSFLAILGPTLTGTLSSEPRYVLAAFPVFMLFASLKKNAFRFSLAFLFSILLFVLSAYFLRGYFVA